MSKHEADPKCPTCKGTGGIFVEENDGGLWYDVCQCVEEGWKNWPTSRPPYLTESVREELRAKMGWYVRSSAVVEPEYVEWDDEEEDER